MAYSTVLCKSLAISLKLGISWYGVQCVPKNCVTVCDADCVEVSINQTRGTELGLNR